MLTEVGLVKVFDQAVRSFLLKEIERKSLAREIAEVKAFDFGSKFVIEKEGAPPIEIEPQELQSRATLANEYIKHSDFDMVGRFLKLSHPKWQLRNLRQ